ncbi:TetR/AcrR family transcriptional regulator [Thiocystis violascens]|uniref:Transcriptional regulator, tetR family n=1 Tax=Thiocystis violascens (strain ATCC 17096 / DSM 198 / 6111) TaxID=765911 RepID=I3Y9X5_THIV6|nr:TetR/AcrR family transcriptional regulator [Thiocystis violascens]AFL73793.1 transcriptional regulator, tetR family [Thiocystis violascens DSM 198]
MIQHSELAARIVDTAVALAERRSWEAIRLHEVADATGIALEEIHQHFREKEDLVAAWFDRADAAMLRSASSPRFAQRSARERLKWVMLSWLDHLEPHRRVTRQMILGQCEPGHLHVQIPAVLRISRTVQWIREAAGLQDAGIRRALAETALTGLFVTTFLYWLQDDSSGSVRTRDLLDALLEKAEWFARRTPGFASRDLSAASTEVASVLDQ